MLPDAAGIYADRKAMPRPPTPRPVAPNDEQRAALRAAADTVGDRALVPTLERLVGDYVEARAIAASAPRLGPPRAAA